MNSCIKFEYMLGDYEILFELYNIFFSQNIFINKKKKKYLIAKAKYRLIKFFELLILSVFFHSLLEETDICY
jgi:hypothetical protein